MPDTGGTDGTGRPARVQLDRADASATPPVRSTPNHVTQLGAMAATGPNRLRYAVAASSASSAPFEPPTRPTRPLRTPGLPSQPLAGGVDGLDGDLAERRGQWIDPEVRRGKHGDSLRSEQFTPPRRDAPTGPTEGHDPACGPGPSGTANVRPPPTRTPRPSWARCDHHRYRSRGTPRPPDQQRGGSEPGRPVAPTARDAGDPLSKPLFHGPPRPRSPDLDDESG